MSLAIIGVSALLVLVRFVRGPSALDRLVALDAIVALIMSGLLVHAAITRDSSVVPAVVAVSLVGFLGSSTVARFLGRAPQSAGRDRGPDDDRDDEPGRRHDDRDDHDPEGVR